MSENYFKVIIPGGGESALEIAEVINMNVYSEHTKNNNFKLQQTAKSIKYFAELIAAEKDDKERRELIDERESLIKDLETIVSDEENDGKKTFAVIGIRWEIDSCKKIAPDEPGLYGFILQHVFYRDFEETRNYWEAWEIENNTILLPPDPHTSSRVFPANADHDTFKIAYVPNKLDSKTCMIANVFFVDCSKNGGPTCHALHQKSPFKYGSISYAGNLLAAKGDEFKIDLTDPNVRFLCSRELDVFNKTYRRLNKPVYTVVCNSCKNYFFSDVSRDENIDWVAGPEAL